MRGRGQTFTSKCVLLADRCERFRTVIVCKQPSCRRAQAPSSVLAVCERLHSCSAAKREGVVTVHFNVSQSLTSLRIDLPQNKTM